MHSDFRLVERSGEAENDRLAAVRSALRSTWELPTDTFVTSTIPLLLTVLGQPAEIARPPCGTATENET